MLPAFLVALLVQIGVPAQSHVEPGAAARDAWQRPATVMDTLGIRAGSSVADIGAGTGYFTFHLARRVGARGRVYAEDIVPSALADIARRARSERLPQITTVLGTDEDPRLPTGLDVVLVVNTYHEFRAYEPMMLAFRRALRAKGRLAIIDCEAQPGELPGAAFRHHRIASSTVKDDAVAAGFRFVRSELGFVDPSGGINPSYWFFLIFERP